MKIECLLQRGKPEKIEYKPEVIQLKGNLRSCVIFI